MFSKGDGEFKYEVIDDFGVIDELANRSLNLRNIRWGDRDKVSLDLRQYYMTENGERMGKGVGFLTDEGPNNLVEVMAGLGFGKTLNILNNIKGREDFQRSLNTALGKDSEFYDESAGEAADDYYDPKSLLE